ncbi:MAG: amidohydrolase [Leptolyngbya sp. SIO4C1]|nr:amidohydrolase [Leptolyngbya sp. SIO4C1]
MLSDIKAIADKIAPRLLEIRRHIHSHPELSGQEYQTAAYAAGVVSSCGFHVQEMVGKTGVVAELPGSGDTSKVLAIRTDMDALPIVEKAELPFTSKNLGMMHACGHDVHTAVGLGAAMILAELDCQFPGTTRFLFQPAEETAQGAKWMIEDGVMQDVEAILGLHVFPSIRAGHIGLRQGALTAAADDLEILIYGESGHGARPHEAVDAIWIATQVVTTLQQSISRTLNPLHPVVLTIGQISGGRAPNVIADQVRLTGTVRSLHPDVHQQIPDWIDKIVAGVCQAHGARYDINYQPRVPSVMNDPVLTHLVADCAQAALGEDYIEWIAEPSLGAEDFALYTEKIPGTMFRLGVGFPDKTNYPLHHPQFEVDERSLLAGVVTMAYSAYQFWQKLSGH